MRKSKKVYSGLDSLPHGMASTEITPGCIALEGGALRGVYTSGVLDALMEAGINFQCTVGISAGALTGINYVSGQIGRNAATSLRYARDTRFMGPKAYFRNDCIVGFDYIYNEINKAYPLDKKRFFDPARRFVAVATNCRTGEPTYFDRDSCSDIFQAVKASSSIPYASKMAMLDGEPYLDGGCSVKVPYAWALEQGYEKVVVIRTLTADYRNRVTPRMYTDKVPLLMKLFYRKYPELLRKLLVTEPRGNAEFEEMQRLHDEGRIFMISPSRDLGFNMVMRDLEKLGSIYYLGYEDGKAAIEPLRAYLAK